MWWNNDDSDDEASTGSSINDTGVPEADTGSEWYVDGANDDTYARILFIVMESFLYPIQRSNWSDQNKLLFKSLFCQI